MLRHKTKTAVIVQKRLAVFDTPRPDQEVDRLADSDPAFAQGTEIVRRLDCKRVAAGAPNRRSVRKKQVGITCRV